MSMSDTLGDMLTRIRNGLHANKAVVEAPSSKFRSNVLEVLKREGYIRDFSSIEDKPGIKHLKIELKYQLDSGTACHRLQRISTESHKYLQNVQRNTHKT